MRTIDGQHRRTAEVRFPKRKFSHSADPKGPTVFLSALLALSGTACPGATISTQDTPSAPRTGAKIEIPFQLVNDHLVIVKATIGNLRNLNMLLDTGTNPSSISEAVAEKLKLPRKAAYLKSLKGTIGAESVVLPGLDFGPLHAAALRVIVQDVSFVARNLGISLDGIIGLDILTIGSFTIDYRRKSIAFGAVSPDLKTIPFAATAPSLIIHGKIDGQEVRLVLDSGTGGLVLYRNPRVMAAASHFDRKASISTGSGSTRLSWLKTRVSVGGEDLGIREIAVADVDSNFGGEFDGLMGFGMLGFHRVAFDFENGRFGWD